MNNLPDPDLIYDLFGSIFKPQFVRLALQLGVFTPLAERPSTAEQVAQACNCDATGMKTLLDYLCALQLLTCEDDRYTLTLTAGTFLVRGRKAYAGDMILDYTDPALYASIAQSIRSGQPKWLNENFVQDAWLESYSPTRIAKSLEMWQVAGVQPENQATFRMLDLACGCAIKSFALAQAAPNVHVTCLDSADVLEVARDLAERMGLLGRVTFTPGDLLTADFGAHCYDAVLIGQITHYLTPAQNEALYGRIYAALKPGGTLLIDCPMAQVTPTESAAFLTLFLWANSGGAAHPFAAYQSWLVAAGFQSIHQLNQRWLTAT